MILQKPYCVYLTALVSLVYIQASFARMRTLDPSQGRFLTRDPLADPTIASHRNAVSMHLEGLRAQLEANVTEFHNLYQYTLSNPVIAADPLGLQATRPSTTQCTCPCTEHPEKCSIQVAWETKSVKGAHRGAYYYPTNTVGKYQLKFQVFATITLVHSEALDLESCHLRQDTEGHASWATREGQDWTTPRDYFSGSDNPAYHGWWFEDSPGIVQSWDHRPASPQTYWWQAHVTVEEAPKVETWWGFAGTASWSTRNDPTYGFFVWSGQQQRVSSILPGRGHDYFLSR